MAIRVNFLSKSEISKKKFKNHNLDFSMNFLSIDVEMYLLTLLAYFLLFPFLGCSKLRLPNFGEVYFRVYSIQMTRMDHLFCDLFIAIKQTVANGSALLNSLHLVED